MQEDFAADLAQAETELGEMNLMKLLAWGSSALLQKAVETEVTRFLGRGYYEHLDEGTVSNGKRHGYRLTTIDTPIGQVVYNRQRINGAKVDDLSRALWKRLREEKINMITQLELDLIAA